MWLNKLGGWIT